MTTIDDGGPFHAFTSDGATHATEPGASLRDVIAIHALAAIIPNTQLGFAAICAEAYQYADAMLAARKVTP
jgi:hypothetical protein